MQHIFPYGTEQATPGPVENVCHLQQVLQRHSTSSPARLQLRLDTATNHSRKADRSRRVQISLQHVSFRTPTFCFSFKKRGKKTPCLRHRSSPSSPAKVDMLTWVFCKVKWDSAAHSVPFQVGVCCCCLVFISLYYECVLSEVS
jgi:hypothetical protein